MLFLIIKFVASNPVEIADSGVIINPNFAVDGGVLISVPDCFPFCGVEAEVQKFEEIKNFFKPCFPFCDVQLEIMNDVIKVPELPTCFPNCGSPTIAPIIPAPPSLFQPCFPFCEVPFPNFDAFFPSCFPFCGVTPVTQVAGQRNQN